MLAELYKYDLLSSLKVEDQSFLAEISKYKKLSYAKLNAPYNEFTFLTDCGISSGAFITFRFAIKYLVGILKLSPEV